MPSTAAERMEKEGGRWLRRPSEREKLWWEAHAAWGERERGEDDRDEGEGGPNGGRGQAKGRGEASTVLNVMFWNPSIMDTFRDKVKCPVKSGVLISG